MKKPYRELGSNSTATNIIRGWLTASSIPVQPSELHDLDVVCQDGTIIGVKISDTEYDTDRYVAIKASDVTARNVSIAMGAFWRVTERAGYNKPMPFDRGAPVRTGKDGNPVRLSYLDNDFLISIRHSEFRRAPNPSDDRWVKYMPTILSVAKRFFSQYGYLCNFNGLTIDDLVQYGRCYMVNFCGRYEIPNPVHHDNERKLYKYIWQRYKEMISVTTKKMQSTTPDKEAVGIALFEDCNADIEVSTKLGPNDLDPEYWERKRAIWSDIKRRLNGLRHGKMVKALKRCANGSDEEVARIASRLLNRHRIRCKSCDGGTIVIQANRPDTLRAVLVAISTGQDKPQYIGMLSNVTERQVRYYTEAASAMGLMAEGDITAIGHDFLDAAEGSEAEAAVLRGAILNSPYLQAFSWFF